MQVNAKVAIDDTTAFLRLYFQARNCHKWGFVSYKVFAKLIRHATGKSDKEDIRRMWQDLFATNCLEKRKIRHSTEYRFIFL